MRCPIRPYRFRIVAATLALLISAGLVGVGVACAYPTHGSTGTPHETAETPSYCAGRASDDAPCAAVSECHVDEHVLSRPSAVVPAGSSCKAQTERSGFAFGAAALPPHARFAEPTGELHSILLPFHEEASPPPVALHLLYAVFLN